MGVLTKKKKIALLVIVFFCIILLITIRQKNNDKQDLVLDLAPDLPLISFARVGFNDLPGWMQAGQGAGEEARLLAALAAFGRSCNKLMLRNPQSSANPVEAIDLWGGASFSGVVADWKPACGRAANLLTENVAGDGAQRFFETYFVPLAIRQPDVLQDPPMRLSAIGRFTGYFEPIFQAARVQSTKFSVPVLSRPDDLVMVDLGQFKESLAGTRIAGRVREGKLVPYADHAEIIGKGIKAEVLAWLDPNDLLFLQIQGSGRLKLKDGSVLRVGYAAQNGHEYTAIGRPLIRTGEIAREDMSMQAIRNWLVAAEPTKAAAMRYKNASYVFFRELKNLPKPKLGPLGAQGVQLTQGVSLAVDRRFYAMGLPIWLDLPENQSDEKLRRLLIAQDTGGAIKGAVRGDIYFGSGTAGADLAGGVNRLGQFFVLLPKPVAERLEQARG